MFALVIIFRWEAPGIWHLNLQHSASVASARRGPVSSKPWTCPSHLNLTATFEEAAAITRPAWRAVNLLLAVAPLRVRTMFVGGALL